MQKYFSINPSSLSENEIKIELLGTIIFLLRYEIKADFIEQDLFSKLIFWNKRKEEMYSFEDVISIINFLEEENILKRNIFNRLEFAD